MIYDGPYCNLPAYLMMMMMMKCTHDDMHRYCNINATEWERERESKKDKLENNEENQK